MDRSSILRTIGTVLLVQLLLAGGRGPVALHAAQTSTPVRVAALRDFAPQYSTGPNGQAQGFAIDTFRALAAQAGLTVEYVLVEDWAAAQAALREGHVDVIPNMGITKRRQEWCRFTSPIETFPVSIFTRTHDTDITGAADLPGKRVGVVRLNVGEVLMAAQPGVETHTYEHMGDALFALLAGHVDALIFPEPVLQNLIRNTGLEDRVKVVGAPLKEIRRGVAVAKEKKALLARLDAAIRDFVRSAQYKSIYARWYGRPTPYWTRSRIVYAAAATLGAVILLMGLWRFRTAVVLNRALARSLERQRQAEQDLETANAELEARVAQRTQDLQTALQNIKTLSGLLPICSYCKKIRNDEGYWDQLEQYVAAHSEAHFSHSICPSCLAEKHPDTYQRMQEEGHAPA